MVIVSTESAVVSRFRRPFMTEIRVDASQTAQGL